MSFRTPLTRCLHAASVLVMLAACSSVSDPTRPDFRVERAVTAHDLPARDAARLALAPLVGGDAPARAAMLRQIVIEECGSAFPVVERTGADVLDLRVVFEQGVFRAVLSRSTHDAALLQVSEPYDAALAAGRDLPAPRWGDDERAFAAFARRLRGEIERLLSPSR